MRIDCSSNVTDVAICYTNTLPNKVLRLMSQTNKHTQTYIAEVEWLLVLRQPSNGGKTERLVRVLIE